MAETIYVSYPHVNEVQDALWAGTHAIERLLQDLNEGLRPLIASWTGAAQIEYGARKAQWDAAVSDMNVTLANGSSTLDLIVDNLKRADLTLAYQWQCL